MLRRDAHPAIGFALAPAIEHRWIYIGSRLKPSQVLKLVPYKASCPGRTRHSGETAEEDENMKQHYLVCKSCHQSWIWQTRVIAQPGLTCKQCGHPWQERSLADLKNHRRTTQWAKWNFNSTGHQWPHRTYKQAFLDPPPGLSGGGRPKKTKVKQSVLQKAIQEHWEMLPTSLKTQCEAMGLQASAPPAPADLPTLIKEHLQSLPSDLKEAVEKLVEPDKPEPTLATKLKQSVGNLKQLAEKKAVLQQKADAVKAQYTALLQELKDMQNKIEQAQKELQETTTKYNQQLEKEKNDSVDENRPRPNKEHMKLRWAYASVSTPRCF